MTTFINGGAGSPGLSLFGTGFDLIDQVLAAAVLEGWTLSAPIGTYPQTLQCPFPVAGSNLQITFDTSGSNVSVTATVPEIAATRTFTTSSFLSATVSSNSTYWIAVNPTNIWFGYTLNNIFPIAYGWGRMQGAPNIGAYIGGWGFFQWNPLISVAQILSGTKWPLVVQNQFSIEANPFTGSGGNIVDGNKFYILPYYIRDTDAFFGHLEGIFAGVYGGTAGQKITLVNNSVQSTYLICASNPSSSFGRYAILIDQVNV